MKPQASTRGNAHKDRQQKKEGQRERKKVKKERKK